MCSWFAKKKTLGELLICPRNLEELSLNDIKQRHPSYTVLCADLGLSTLVDVYSGVMSDNAILIHLGEFVKFSDSDNSNVS